MQSNYLDEAKEIESLEISKSEQTAIETRDLIFNQLTSFSWFRLLIASYAIGTTWTALINYYTPSVPVNELYPQQCIIPDQAYYDQLIFNLEVLAGTTFGLWIVQVIYEWFSFTRVGFYLNTFLHWIYNSFCTCIKKKNKLEHKKKKKRNHKKPTDDLDELLPNINS